MGWAKDAEKQLVAGHQAQVRPFGGSMRGRIESDQLVTIAPVNPALVQVNDIVFVQWKGNYLLHLIKEIKGSQVLIGNNLGKINGWVSAQAILGRVVAVDGRLESCVCNRNEFGQPLPGKPAFMRVKAIKEHKSAYPNPITFQQGEQVQVGKRDTLFLGWIWTTTNTGNSGWAPEQILEINGSRAVAKEDYNARELNTALGEVLAVYRELSEWYWASNAAGEYGWVPVTTVCKI